MCDLEKPILCFFFFFFNNSEPGRDPLSVFVMLYGLSEEEKFVYSFTRKSVVRVHYRAMSESHLSVQSPGNVLILTRLSLQFKGINLPRKIKNDGARW